MLRADCSLTDLAKLAEADDAKVAAWVSSWGLLGFRLVGAVPPFLGGGWTAPTDLGERLGVHYEPVDLIKKAAREASAVTRLHAALKIEGPKENSARNIQNLLRIDPVFGDPSLQTFKVSMSIDRIHLGEFSMPKSAYAWKRLAVAMLGSLSERYLASEFRLRWTLSDKFTKLKTYWEIRSLLGGLYFKLGAEYREARKFCEVCGNPILAHRSTKKTCGDRCRQRKRRHQFQSGEPA